MEEKKVIVTKEYFKLRKDVLLNAYKARTIFERWSVITNNKLTSYDFDMFEWLALFGMAQDDDGFGEIAEDEELSFIAHLLGVEYSESF